MCKIIGIYGHKSAEQEITAWLLAQAIEHVITNRNFDTYMEFCGEALKRLRNGELSRQDATSTNHVILDSFGANILDQVKLFNPNLQGWDLCDAEIKFSHYVHLTSLNVFQESELEEHCFEVLTLDELCARVDSGIEDTWVVNINDYILYFADRVIKRYFGENVWLNATIALNNLMGLTDHRIYWDVKTQPEVDYIKEQSGLIIELRSKYKAKGYRKFKSLKPDGILPDLSDDHYPEQIYKIAEQIVNN